MTESLIASAAEGIFTGLVSLATQQINLAWSFEEDLKKLRDTLTYVQALLRDAEGKRTKPEHLKEWIKSLKAGACHAENVLDELAYEDLRRKIEGRKLIKDRVRNLEFRRRMAKKVNGVILLLKNICNEANKFSLIANEIANTSAKPRVFKPTGPWLDDSHVVGRHDDMSVVKQMLLGSEEEDELSIVAVQGMGGLGKTTLAQLVFKDEEVVNNFGDKRMWICVSDDFGVQRILNEMVQSFGGDKSKTPNIQGLVRKLKQQMRGDKYLLVLDDVWNENKEEWVRLRDSLIEIGGLKGSKILVTTRMMDVVSTMQISPSMTHHLNTLSDDHCCAMFKKRVFSKGGPKWRQSLEDIGIRMVQKCKGMPLAVNSLAGLLYTKQFENEWESIDASERWHSLASENSILPILRLSYDHLPTPSLKRCFAYCAVFPKDAYIDKDMLIRHWMGLGYLHSSEKALKMEDLGNEYFNILLRSSFFQEPKLDTLGNITSCKMHDLVHDLALDVAEGSVTSKASDIKSHPEVQHLSLHLEEETSLGIQQENVGNARTLLLTGHLPKNFDAVKCVRILHLREDVPKYLLDNLNSEREQDWEQDGYKCHFKELPRSMRKFIHLRYLDLSYTRITKLPDFITGFYKLETLVLPSSLQHFPKDFHKLVSLRHLCMDESPISPTVILAKLGHMFSLQTLPPAKLGHMSSLQTLPLFVVGEDEGHKIEELGSLKQLRGRLCVKNLMFVNDGDEAKKANIGSKKDIQELVFHFGLERSHANHVDVLEGLQPHKNLKCLTLQEFGGKKFASWMPTDNPQFLRNLVKIELRRCQVCEQVPTLGHLQHLEVVVMAGLDELTHIGLEFYGLEASRREVFPALRKLELWGMRKLEEWSDVSSLLPAVTSEKKFFPRLEEVLIFGCPMLVILPDQLLSVQFQSIRISNIYTDNQTLDRPSLKMAPPENSKNNALLLENLLGKSRSLRNLDIEEWEGLHCLPKQILNLTSLEKLCIERCSDLIYVFEETEVTISTGLPSLQYLRIFGCHQLRCLPKGLLQPNLTEFHIEWCESLECDEYDYQRLTSQKNMSIRGCSRLGSFWEKGLACLTSLQGLIIGAFSKEVHFPWPSYPHEQHPFSSLEFLYLEGWENLTCLPNLGHLTALKDLHLEHFPNLEALPEWVGDLSSLQSLVIWRCKNLKSLPSRKVIQRLANAKLQRLNLYYCPILEEQLKQESGEERHKIALIPLVDILAWDGEYYRYRYSQKELDH